MKDRMRVLCTRVVSSNSFVVPKEYLLFERSYWSCDFLELIITYVPRVPAQEKTLPSEPEREDTLPLQVERSPPSSRSEVSRVREASILETRQVLESEVI